MSLLCESHLTIFKFIDLLAGIGGLRLALESPVASASLPVNGMRPAARLTLQTFRRVKKLLATFATIKNVLMTFLLTMSWQRGLLAKLSLSQAFPKRILLIDLTNLSAIYRAHYFAMSRR